MVSRPVQQIQVVLADGDDVLRAGLARVLRARGLSVWAVARRSEARRALTACPEVLVVDAELAGPGLWGLLVRAESAGVGAVVVLAASPLPRDPTRHWGPCPVVVLPKPVRGAALVRAVEVLATAVLGNSDASPTSRL